MNANTKKHRCIKQHFIHGLNSGGMTKEIIKKLTALSDTSLVTSSWVLAWAKTVEAQKSQMAMLKGLNDNTKFNAINAHRNYTKQMHPEQRHTTPSKQKPYKRHPPQQHQVPSKQSQRCKYHHSIHFPRKCSMYGKICGWNRKWTISKEYIRAQNEQQYPAKNRKCKAVHDVEQYTDDS